MMDKASDGRCIKLMTDDVYISLCMMDKVHKGWGIKLTIDDG